MALPISRACTSFVPTIPRKVANGIDKLLVQWRLQQSCKLTFHSCKLSVHTFQNQLANSIARVPVESGIICGSGSKQGGGCSGCCPGSHAGEAGGAPVGCEEAAGWEQVLHNLCSPAQGDACPGDSSGSAALSLFDTRLYTC